MHLLLEQVDLSCHVSLPEGNYWYERNNSPIDIFWVDYRQIWKDLNRRVDLNSVHKNPLGLQLPVNHVSSGGRGHSYVLVSQSLLNQ